MHNSMNISCICAADALHIRLPNLPVRPCCFQLQFVLLLWHALFSVARLKTFTKAVVFGSLLELDGYHTKLFDTQYSFG